MRDSLFAPGCLTPLQAWIGTKIGAPDYTLAQLRAYQLSALQRVFAYARENSPFYRRHYAGMAAPAGWDDFFSLPFTDDSLLREQGTAMLCQGQNEIARIVTLDTSGTTATPKRVYFTAADQELTIDYFHHGLLTMTLPQDNILILLPTHRPGCVGDLLAKAALRFNAVPIPHGAPLDFPATALLLTQAQMVVANPLHMLMLAETALQLEREGQINSNSINLRAILLSTDYVADSLRRRLSQQFGCPVLEHYGLTETGLGAAVSCSAMEGYHLREADLYVEIIDPNTGQTLPEGEYGEIVFSTLTRQALPLLRYRSGDYGRYLTEPCPCGSILPRLDKVKKRLNSYKLNSYKLDSSQLDNCQLDITAFDELLLGLAGLANYELEVCGQQLHLRGYGLGEPPIWPKELANCHISWQQGLPPNAGSLGKRKIMYGRGL